MSLISFNLMPRIVALAHSTATWTRKGVSKYVSQGVEGTYGFSEISSKSAIVEKWWKVEKRGGGQRAHALSGRAATMRTHSRISSCWVSTFGHLNGPNRSSSCHRRVAASKGPAYVMLRRTSAGYYKNHRLQLDGVATIILPQLGGRTVCSNWSYG